MVRAWVLLFVALLGSATALCSNCSGHGTCISSSYCVCQVGWLGGNCSIGGPTVATSYWFSSQSGSKLIEYWVDSSVNYLHVRLSVQPTGYFGIIFNPATDGMSGGDCWMMSATSSAVIIQDRWSASMKTPSYDTTQSLEASTGYKNSTNQVFYFMRALQNSDKYDIQFCTTAGCKVRFVWTEADSALSASSSVVNTNSNGRDNSGGISMHKMVGYCGQLIIDWVGGTVYQSTMGVQWPSIYWYWLYSAAAVLGAGLFTQRQFVKQSSFGRWLRTPLNLLTVGEKYKQQSDSEPWDDWLLNFFSTFSSLTINEFVLVLVYFAVWWVVSIVYSNFDYSAVGRPPSYVISHLAVLHMAVGVLPITRHSIWLPLLNVDYEVAIDWHRRLARVGILLVLCHGISMIVNWDGSVLFSVASVNSAGGATLFGTLSFVCLLILLITSLQRVRNIAYEWFYNCHIFLGPLSLFFACLHSINMRYMLIAPAVLWAIDIVTRLVRMYVLYPSAKRAEVVSAIVYKDGASVMTRLDLSWPSALSINDMNEFAGGFFVVYCPEISNAQWHPMSISSAFPPAPTSSASATDIELSAVSKSKNPTFSLHIAATEPGQWTNALAAHLLSLSPNNTSNIVQLANPQLTVRVYGPMANRDLQVMDFPSLILIAGGVGVTPCVSVLDTLLHRYETQQSQQVVHLIWSSRSTQALTQWFAPIFDRVPSAAQYFKLHLYNTRATAPTSSGALTVLNGRPDLGLLMDEILASGSQQSLTPAQTAVFTCGPHAMMDQAQAIAASRGCHFHRESFAK